MWRVSRGRFKNGRKSISFSEAFIMQFSDNDLARACKGVLTKPDYHEIVKYGKKSKNNKGSEYLCSYIIQRQADDSIHCVIDTV